MTDSEKLLQLKELLLAEDRDLAHQILEKLDQLEETLYLEHNLSDKVHPIIDKKLDAFIKEIPAALGPTITQTLKVEVKNSQETIVEALFPIIGKMIKRYIQQEIKALSDSINEKVQSAFSFKKMKRNLKALITGVSVNEIALSELARPKLQQIFVIEKGSGIIIASYSKTQSIDQDMIAGMLTAIKSFVEDAFAGGNQNLENIEYELYTIQIQNFSSYYMAAVLSGSINNKSKSYIQDQMLEFADSFIKNNLDNRMLITQNLEEQFKDE